ncbi:MAG: cytochrome-c oxidase, cbb3-type subunit II, partial [Persicimonas sp.]
DLPDPEVEVPVPSWRLNASAEDQAPAKTYDEALHRLQAKLKDGWHRFLEGWPLVFTVLTTIAVLVGGAVEIIPTFMIDSTVPRIESVKPYTPLELEGRDIYIREGCVQCHSQMVRPLRQEIERYGEYSKAGEAIYDRPFLWGSKRTGPDLARVGGKYPDLWHVRHMEDPRSTSPNSIMPPYPHLLEKEIDFDGMTKKLEVQAMLNVPYSAADIDSAAEDARTQSAQIAASVEEQKGYSNLHDREITALVAYLQRLGADLKKENGEQQSANGTANGGK